MAHELLDRYERALGARAAPVAFVDMDALGANADDMLRRAGDAGAAAATGLTVWRLRSSTGA